MNSAWITLLATKNYIEAVIILARSLKTVKSNYPLLVMVLEDIYDFSAPFLAKESNIIIEKIKPLSYSQAALKGQKYKYLSYIASKLCCFQFKTYDKLIYLDADSIILQNIDDLFNYPDTSMYKELNYERGFAGLFVICPKNHDELIYNTLLKYTPYWDCDILEGMWTACREDKNYQIPFEYFINITIKNLDSCVTLQTIKGMHFCYFDKPWHFINAEDYCTALNKRTNIENSKVRNMVINYYYSQYLIPLRKQYNQILMECSFDHEII